MSIIRLVSFIKQTLPCCVVQPQTLPFLPLLQDAYKLFVCNMTGLLKVPRLKYLAGNKTSHVAYYSISMTVCCHSISAYVSTNSLVVLVCRKAATQLSVRLVDHPFVVDVILIPWTYPGFDGAQTW